MSDNNTKVFEDEFMEVQSGLISLCLEFLGDNKVDEIFAYCSIEEKSYSFNAFFRKNGEITKKENIESNMRRIVQFLRTGTADLEKVKEVCIKHQMPIPTEIKMYYDTQTGKFNAGSKYTPVCVNISAGEIFDQGFAEYKNR